VITPLQTQTMKQLFHLRKKSMIWTGMSDYIYYARTLT
jgi:hypothetical protein